MKITKKTQIAIILINFLSAQNKIVTITMAAQTLKIEKNHLKSVVNILSKGKILSTSFGPKGGVELTRKGQNITFIEIFNLFNEISLDCSFKENEMGCDNCILQNECTLEKAIISITLHLSNELSFKVNMKQI